MRFSRAHNKTAIAGLVIYTACLVTAMVLCILNQISQADIARTRQVEDNATTRYAGTVIIPDPANGRCRHLEFDNNTGAFREGTTSTCRDDTPAVNSTQGRINAIRDAFVRH